MRPVHLIAAFVLWPVAIVVTTVRYTRRNGPIVARRFGPDAIMLDIGLPDMDGLALLDLLKRTPETRHIPVHVISADDQKGLGLSMGAVGFTHKPVEREVVVSTLQGVKTFADKSDRKIVLIGGEGEAADTLRQCFTDVEVAADFASLVARPAAELPDAVVVESTAVALPQLLSHACPLTNCGPPSACSTPVCKA